MHPMNERDVTEMVTIAEGVYPAFDKAQATLWAMQGLRQPDMLMLRDGDSGIIASITQAFWGGPRRCYLLFLFGKKGKRRIWEACRLLKACDDWRKERGAESFHFGEDTGVDFAPLAKRMGAKMDRPSWRIDGGHKQAPDMLPRLTMALSGMGRLSALQQAMRV